MKFVAYMIKGLAKYLVNKIEVKMSKVKVARKKSLEAEKKKKPDMNVLIVDFYVYYVLNYLLTFNSFLFFQNIIFRINAIPRTNLNCQWLFYTLWYITGGIGFINTVKRWRQTTETTTIWCTLTIFNHWYINVKLHFLHIFGISNWNYKHFKFIFIFFFIMPLKCFPIEISFTCDTFSSIQ